MLISLFLTLFVSYLSVNSVDVDITNGGEGSCSIDSNGELQCSEEPQIIQALGPDKVSEILDQHNRASQHARTQEFDSDQPHPFNPETNTHTNLPKHKARRGKQSNQNHSNETDNENTENNENNENNDDIPEEPLDPNDPDFDILNFDPTQYKYEYPCPGLEAGWTCDYSIDYSQRDGDHFFCDADIVQPDISAEEFNSKYLFKKPVLINTTISDWTEPSFWSRRSLVKRYGDFQFEAGRSLELVLNAGIGPVNLSLRDYLRDPYSLHFDKDFMGPYDAPFKEKLYIFDRSIWQEEHNFKKKHFHPPKYLHNGDPEYGILFIGGTGTGATWHGHGETWATEAYGRKRWMLYPPEITPPGGFWPGYSALDWYNFIYPYLSRKININEPTKFNIIDSIYRHSVFQRKDYISVPMTNLNSTNVDKSLIINEFKGYGVEPCTECTDDERIEQLKRLRTLYSDTNNNNNNNSNNNTRLRTRNFKIEKIDDIFKTDLIEMNLNHDSGLYKPIECIQAEGQILYLPEFWFHSVLNLGDVVASGIQTSASYSQWMQEIDHLGKWEKDLDDDGSKQLHKKPLTDLEKEIQHWKLLKLHDRLEQMSPNNAIHPFFVGFEYNDLGYRDKGLHDISRAIKMDPAYIEAYNHLGRIYRNSGVKSQLRKGEHAWRIAYMLNPNHPTIRENLIDLFKHQGRDDLVLKVEKHEKLPPMDIPPPTEFRKERKRKIKDIGTKINQEIHDQHINQLEKDQENQETQENEQNDNENENKNENDESENDQVIPEPTEQFVEDKGLDQTEHHDFKDEHHFSEMVNNVI